MSPYDETAMIRMAYPAPYSDSRLRGSAVTDGDAFVKIEGIVEGY